MTISAWNMRLKWPTPFEKQRNILFYAKQVYIASYVASNELDDVAVSTTAWSQDFVFVFYGRGKIFLVGFCHCSSIAFTS